MRRHPISFILLSLLAVCATSCIETAPDHLTYVVEITPTAKGLERKVSIVRSMNNDSTQTPLALRVEAEVADRFERLYGRRPNSIAPESLGSDTTVVYRTHGKFAQIPNDIGGWGVLRRYDSSLGTSYAYKEAFRWNDDLLAPLEQRLGAADSIADLTIGWAEANVGHLAGWPALHSYLDCDVRRNLRNCALRLWSVDSTTDEVANTFAERDSTIAGLQVLNLFLLVSEYRSSPAEIPDSLAGEPAMEQYLVVMRAAFGARLGLRGREETDRTLSFLSRPDTACVSLTRYLASASNSSPEDMVARWNRLSLVTVPGVLGENGYTGWDSVVVKLTIPSESAFVLSTGEDKFEPHRVVWSGRVPKPGSRGRLDPLICSASWQMPERVVQRKLFGDVILEGPDLDSYAMWIDLLDPRQRAEWERMLVRLRPGKLEPLETFRFSSGRSLEYGGKLIGRDLILRAIEANPIRPE